jgi:hypothetical protein
MPRAKSLLKRVTINQALRSHNCQSNSRHRIQKDEKRLLVEEGNKKSYYCVNCAKIFLKNARIEIDTLLKEFDD